MNTTRASVRITKTFNCLLGDSYCNLANLANLVKTTHKILGERKHGTNLHNL